MRRKPELISMTRTTLIFLLLFTSCRSTIDRTVVPVPPNSIIVCGEPLPTAAPVVPWFAEPRYDAYATEPRFSDTGPSGLRYSPGRNAMDA